MSLARRSALYLALSVGGLLLGVAAYEGSRRLSQTNSPPALRHAELVDLGEVERGSIAEGAFWVQNAGGGTLVLDRFRTNCSCAGVERKVDGKYLGVESVHLGPGERVELTLRMSVGGTVGQRHAIGLSFASNDPDRPHGLVEAAVSRVMGGVVTLPSAVTLGQLAVGASQKQSVKVYDGGRAGRRVCSVRSTQPQRFRVDFAEGGTAEYDERAGNLLGRIEITAVTADESPLDGEIEITLANEDRRPDVLSVVGQVVSNVGVAPRSLLLPRMQDGKAVYHAELRVWSHDGRPVSARVEPASHACTAEVFPVEGKADQRRIRLEWKPDRAGGAANEKSATVRLLIRAGDKDYVRDIQILRHQPEP